MEETEEKLEEKLEGGQDDGAISAREHNKSAPHTSVNQGSGERDGVYRCVGRAFVVLARAYGTIILPPLQLLLQHLLCLLHILLMTG